MWCRLSGVCAVRGPACGLSYSFSERRGVITARSSVQSNENWLCRLPGTRLLKRFLCWQRLFLPANVGRFPGAAIPRGICAFYGTGHETAVRGRVCSGQVSGVSQPICQCHSTNGRYTLQEKSRKPKMCPEPKKIKNSVAAPRLLEP